MKLIANLAPLDQQAITTYGIPGLQLMEAAGQAVATLVQSLLLADGPLETEQSPSIVILCGLGNNGGDGFVCARLLSLAGFPVTLITEFSQTELSQEALLGRLKSDTLHNAQRLFSSPVHWLSLKSDTPESIKTVLQHAACIVDGIFGSGLSRPISGQWAQLIHTVNALPKDTRRHIIAIDLPSGIDGATGQFPGQSQGAEALQATHTLTFACPKPGLFLHPGKAAAGVVSVADIGLPNHLIETDPSPLSLITPNWAAKALPVRKPDGHKYDFGHVLIIGGCQRMPGAVSLAASSALRSGCGLVTLASLPSVLESAHLPPEVVRLPLSPQNNDFLDRSATETLLDKLEQVDAILFGPGLGLSEDTALFSQQCFSALLNYCQEKPVIIDADAITLLAHLQGENRVPHQLPQNWILTPHVGEFCRVTTQEKAAVLGNLPQAALTASQELGCTVVLKSATTLIASVSHGQPYCHISPTGHSGMATAGSGDVLAGLIAGLCAQVSKQNTESPSHLRHFNAASLGVYLHGIAGMIAGQQKTDYCMLASDMIEALPTAFHQILNSNY